MTVIDENMMINAVDDNDMPIGTITRSSVFRAHANFRVAHILVFNSKGELLVQRLGLNRKRHAGYWGSSVAAYVFASESYENAAARRISQELGIRSDTLLPVGKTTMDDEGCKKFISVFTTIQNGPFDYDHEHIDQIEFLPLARIHELHNIGERNFTPTFLHVLNFYEAGRRTS
jgi:isopentenyldiphosphate isomerase